MKYIKHVIPYTPSQSVSLVAGAVADLGKGVSAIPPSGILRIYVTDYRPRPKFDHVIARFQKLRRMGVPRQSVRLEIMQGMGDPRLPWETPEIRRFMEPLMETCPEIVAYLDMPSLAIVERCLRRWIMSGPVGAYHFQHLSKQKHKLWRKLAADYGIDAESTDAIVARADRKSGTYYI